MHDLIRDLEIFRKISVDPHLPVFCDTETTEDEGLSSGGLYGKIRLFQIFQSTWKKAVVIDCFFIPLNEVLNLLQPHHLIFHNGSFDLHTINLKTEETWLPKELDDTLYLSRLKYFTKQKFGFYECLKYSNNSDSLIDGIDKKEEQKSDWSGALSDRQLTYAAADVVYLAKLYESVKEFKTSTVYNLDINNLKYAVNYARNGMPVNQNRVLELKKEYVQKLEDTFKQLPPDLNVRSSKQCCIYLNSKSSAHDVLLEMAQEGNERAKRISDARSFFKSLEYLKAYDRPVIKGFFNPCAALSGRFSCTGGNRYDHVNLQQIPNSLHDIVEAPDKYRIVYKDYSGIELRMAVAFTGEEVMAQMMKSGADMHTETAKYVFEKEDISYEDRTIAKTFNFGLIYGVGVKTVQSMLKLQANLDLPFQEVKRLMNRWFELYEGFTVWHDMHKYQFNVFGYVDIETALGRRIRTYSIPDSLNFPIQGSSVEVTKVSIGLLYSRYPELQKVKHILQDDYEACLINTIHDSNILLAKEEETEKWGNRLSECMVDAWKYVISELADPEIPMPHGYDAGPVWTFH
jgi:DNA polymerase I-like protein with 3'-5' exonuclease and polymerase domains